MTLSAALQRTANLSLIAERLSSAAAAVILIFHALRRKTHMSDLPNDPGAHAPDAPIATAAAEPAAAASVPAVSINPTNVVNSVIQTVQAHPDVPAAAATSVIASILGGLYQAEPAIFAVSRASAKTQTEFGLGFGLLQIILGA